MILADLLDFSRFLPLAIFGLFAAAAWWVLERFATGKPRAEQRLDEFRDPQLRRREEKTDGRMGKKSDAVAKLLEKASPALAKPLKPKSDKDFGKLTVIRSKSL